MVVAVAGLLPPALALLAGVGPHVVAVALVPSPGGRARFLAGAGGRSCHARGGGPRYLSL